MVNRITTADARKKFSTILNRVAFGKETFVLTRHGEPLAAIVSVDTLGLLQEPLEQKHIDNARKAQKDPGKNVPWEKLRKELDL